MTGRLELSAELDPAFEQLFEASVHPAFVIEPFANRILAVNDAGCAMLGYTREELLELPVSRVHPAELPQFREFLRRVLADAHGTAMKLTCRTKDGTFLPTEMSLVALLSGGRAYILGLVRDRSEHRGPAPGD